MAAMPPTLARPPGVMPPGAGGPPMMPRRDGGRTSHMPKAGARSAEGRMAKAKMHLPDANAGVD